MHGGTLKEIQDKLPQPHEEIIDTLGRIVLLALVNQFPQELLLSEKLNFLQPSTYVHRRLSGIAHVQTIVPTVADELDLSFPGTKIEMTPGAPPQSAAPSLLGMERNQYERLRKLAFKPGDHQEMCRRIVDRIHQQNETHVGLVVLSTDMKRILDAVKGGEEGDWQDLFREILEPKPDAS